MSEADCGMVAERPSLHTQQARHPLRSGPIRYHAAMNTDTDIDPDDYDSPWKAIIEQAFPEFMVFYFAQIHARIDWDSGYAFKNTELRQVVRDAELGKRFADVLVCVTLKTGEQQLIYIHIEVQGRKI